MKHTLNIAVTILAICLVSSNTVLVKSYLKKAEPTTVRIKK
jgi:hypothetical protein